MAKGKQLEKKENWRSKNGKLESRKIGQKIRRSGPKPKPKNTVYPKTWGGWTLSLS